MTNQTFAARVAIVLAAVILLPLLLMAGCTAAFTGLAVVGSTIEQPVTP